MLGNTVKKIFVILTIAMLLVPASGVFAQAGGGGGAAGSTSKKVCGVLSGEFSQCIIDGIDWLFGQLGSWLNQIAAFLISLAAGFIDVMINESSAITKSPLVQEGFKITLNIANLGFVLAIIIIAFATILRISGYGLKNILWKLVVAALLVNFSFAIAGVIIDFNNILGNYFLEAATPQKIKGISQSLGDLLSIQKLAAVTPSFTDQLLEAVVTLAAVVIFNVLLVIVFFALAVMLLIRYVYLTILLIFMPLVWVFWIFPAMEGHWKKWWDKFFQWNFFFPGIAFFVYLSIVANEKFSETIQKGVLLSDPSKSAATIANLDLSQIAPFLQILLVSGLLFGGLMAAQAFGIASASSVIGMAKGVAGRVTGTVGRAGRLAGKGIWEVGGGRVFKAATGWLANQLTRPAFRVIPGVKTATAGLARFSSRKSEVEEYQKKTLSDLTNDQLQRVAKTNPWGPVPKAALLAELGKRKKVEWLTAGITDEEKKKARLKDFKQAADVTNPELSRDITKTNPSYAPELTGKTVKEALAGSRGSEINKDELKKDEVAENISHPQISDIVREGIPEKLEGLEQSLRRIANIDEEAFKKLQAKEGEIANVLRNIKELKQQGASKGDVQKQQTDLKKLRTELKTIYTPTDPDPKKAESKRFAYEKLQLLKQKPGQQTYY